MSDKRIAIVDCNNFYVSCERLFNPKIRTKPTIVMSNNDGCVIARSQEVKDMGIRMGQHLFSLDEKLKASLEKFSSNYVLYGDISDRISNILRTFTPTIEIYSIDESFLDVSHVPEEELEDQMQTIRTEVMRLTGIPVSIGVAPNKTLAKLMNQRAKKEADLRGVCIFGSHGEVDSVGLGEVWGIGPKWKEKLADLGVTTIGEFKLLSPHRVKSLTTIVGLRTWMELNGERVFSVETKFKRPKVVTSSRSFGKKVWQEPQIFDALCSFIGDGCKKLKGDNLKARRCFFFLETDRFKGDYLFWFKKIRLYEPSSNLQSIWNEIFPNLDGLPSKVWARAGVIFFDLVDERVEIPRLFPENYSTALIPDLKDKIWMTRRDSLSPNWTTSWQEIPKLF